MIFWPPVDLLVPALAVPAHEFGEARRAQFQHIADPHLQILLRGCAGDFLTQFNELRRLGRYRGDVLLDVFRYRVPLKTLKVHDVLLRECVFLGKQHHQTMPLALQGEVTEEAARPAVGRVDRTQESPLIRQ